MIGSAGRPNGSNGPPDARPGREPESASFETARLRTRRGTQPIFILGFLALVGGFVAVGLGGQSVGQPTFSLVALDSAPPTTAAPTAGKSPATTMPVFIREASIPPDQLVTTGPGPIELKAQRQSRSMYIHGDVFVPGVTWVFVSLQDDNGRVAGWASVSVPGAAGPARGDGPTLRFDVDVAVPDGFEGTLWLNANAYDSSSSLITSVRLEVGPLTRSRMQFEP